MIAALARLPLRRLLVSRRAWWALGGWALVTLAVSWARARGGASATDPLLGVYAGLALPLLSLALTSAVCCGDRLQVAARSLTRVGASGPLVGLTHVLVAALACAVAGSTLAIAVATLAHGPADTSLGRDLATCAWVGALSGGAYAGVFSLGSTFGRGGAGRGVVLVMNWIAGGGALGVALPHGHVRSLLGGDPAGALSQKGSAVALVLILVVSASLSALRARKPE